MIHIRVEPVGKGYYELLESIIIEGIRIPSGFKWNGASIPRFFWRVVGTPFQPKYMAPSMVHDFLCGDEQYSRKEADKLFYKLLLVNGVNKILARTMYYGVRIGAR